MIGTKEHADSILFLNGKISKLQRDIIKAHDETLHFIKDTPSAINSSRRCLKLQYELECTQTLLQVVNHSLDRLNDLSENEANALIELLTPMNSIWEDTEEEEA